MIIEDFKSIKTTKVAILGNPKEALDIWIVLHGYGQLSNYFIKKFKILSNNNISVIAPEAQSRFYNEGFNGRVGATWMTKEERETDIADYINYLNSVYNHYFLKNKRITLLGFSQGGATAARWYSKNSQLFEKLILWSSVFPSDFKIDDFNISKCTLIVGDNDPFMTNTKYNQIEKLSKNNPSLEMITFKGGHDIEINTLKKVAKIF